MKIKGKIGALITASYLLPALVFAQATTGNLSNLDSLVTSAANIINKLIPIMFALAIVAFFYGLVRYLFGGEESKVSAKKTMLWGVIAIFVMAAVWGLVAWLGGALGIQTDAPGVGPDITLPTAS